MTIIIENTTCNRCGICADVCPMGVISPPTDDEIPAVPVTRAGYCISCGQCTAFCPTGALTLQKDTGIRPEPAWKGEGITPDLMVSYLKSRRSIRNFKSEPVPRETITALLDAARYAASGGNGQPVQWLVIQDPKEVRHIAEGVIDWMRTLEGSSHPMSGYIPSLIARWKAGNDVICRGAPHLLIPHVPDGNPMALTDGIIALTHVDIAAPAFGVGTCWAGFIAMAIKMSPEFCRLFDLPKGRIPLYALMFGYPRYKPRYIPTRKEAEIIWR